MKRILSLILCLVLCLSLLPLGAMAENAESGTEAYVSEDPADSTADAETGEPEQPEETNESDGSTEETNESDGSTEPPSDEPENDGSDGESVLTGSGTPDEPYRIGTEQELAAVAELVNGGISGYASAYYIVTDDIYLSSAFSPVGTAEHPFGGTFDGCGHKISSLAGDGSGSVFGLFGVTDGAVISRLALEYADISGSYERVGAIIGVMHGGSIGECYVTGSLVNDAEGSYVGGLVGECDGAVIENCYNGASVGGYSVVGGVVGYAEGASSVSCCYGSGRVGSSHWNDTEGYVIGYAEDSVSYDGIRAINGTDFRGYTLRDEHLTRTDCFEGYDFESIWELSWCGAPVLRNNTEARALLCMGQEAGLASNEVTGDYRALIIGEEDYAGDMRRPGKITADIIEQTLKNSDAPWNIDIEYDLPMADMSDTLDSVYGTAASDSVNFFFYCGHGYNDDVSNPAAGSITDTDNNLMSPKQLASLMNSYDGHFIVILDSCGSGGVIATNSSASSDSVSYYNQAVIDAFDRVQKLNELPAVGPMRTSKFSVITACAVDEVSYSSFYELYTSDDKLLGYFCLGYWFSECAGLSTEFNSVGQIGIETQSGELKGDADKNSRLTVAEAYSYLYDKALHEKYNGNPAPHVQVWPSNDSTVILSRVNRYTVTYDANGGENAPNSQTQDAGQSIVLRDTEPTRTFYRFLGWADSKTASAAQYQSGGEYTFSQNTTLYAVWDGPYSQTGQCGDHLNWTLTSEGVLTITGTGDMWDYNESYPSTWYPYRKSIKNAVITEGATSIGKYIFNDCGNLESVSIPSGIKSIGDGAFRDCDSLGSVSITGDTESIGDSAFRDSDGLKSVIINEGTTEIGELAFYNSCGIQTLYIPHSVTSIGKDALDFAGEGEDCADVCDVYYSGTKAEWDVLAADAGCRATMHFSDGVSGVCGDGLVFTLDSDGVLTIIGTGRMYNFTDDYTPWYSVKANIKSVVVTEDVENIGNSAFVSCGNLASVSLPASLTEIGSAAFRYCSALKKLSVPAAVGSIGSEAFANSGLTEFEFPAGITSVNASALANCTALAKVTIPDTVTEIGGYAFSGCTALTDVYYSYTRAKWNTITKGAQNDALTSATLHCSKFTVDYDANGGTGAPETQIKSKGTPITLSSVSPTLSGGHFIGWSSSPTATTAEYQPDGTYSADADIVLYALWLKGYLLETAGLNLTDAEQVYADGKPCRIITFKGKEYAVIAAKDAKILTVNTLNDPSFTDVHYKYPVAMKIYKLTFDEGLNEFTAANIPELDNLLTYSGTSIRISGVKGIRCVTSVNEELRGKLINTYAGYTLEEYGTLMCWASDMVDGSLVFGGGKVGTNYAYKKGVADPIFRRRDGMIQYTNVLTVPTLEKWKDDVAMRPYIILRDSDGQSITIYGGIVYRSVGYVAYQNRSAFEPGTDGYRFIWEIIHSVYGDVYDEEYKG